MQNCQKSQIKIKRGFVIQRDRIFFSISNSFGDTCHAASGCCDYISRREPGYCSDREELVLFPEHYKPHKFDKYQDQDYKK